MDQPILESERIQRLRRDLPSFGDHALSAFWREVEAAGTPLVEEISGDDEHVLVTFVYRGDAETRAVIVSSLLAGYEFPQLSRLHGSDVWHRSAAAPKGVRTAYSFIVNPPTTDLYGGHTEEVQRWFGDPANVSDDALNPLKFQCGALTPRQSVIELPGADPQQWLAERDVPRGRLAPHRFESAVLGGARVVWTYEPPGYNADAGPYPVLVLHDGYSYANMPIHTTLDNLIAAQAIPPMVCALYQWADRTDELACNEDVARALTEDLVGDWLPRRLHVTADASRTIIGGLSLGGLAAMFTALRHPDVFGNVISQSGSYWWGPGATIPADMTMPGIEWEWLNQAAARPASSPIRAYLEVGAIETSPMGGRTPDMIGSNRRMRDALSAGGHEVLAYNEYNGGHDYVCWRGSLADALIAVAGPWIDARA